jgi:simple sugar transport system permease protein
VRRLFIACLAASLAVALLIAIGVAAGYEGSALLRTLVAGSIGTPFAIAGSIVKTTPLLLTGLAVAVAFRSGVWNIGAEGQFITGALAGYLAAPWGVIPSLCASMLAGAAWASIAMLMRLWRGAPEVLTTILLNFIAIHLLGWCVNGPLQERAAQYPQTDAAPFLLPRSNGVHAGIVIAVAAAIIVWWLMHHTMIGLRLRATGDNPRAAAWAGIDVPRQMIVAMALSGALAGLAGGVELLGVTGRLFERFASGYGYSAIAVALLAQLHPLATLLSATFFGALATGAGELQRSENISSAIAVLGQATAILTLLLFSRSERHRWSS